MYFVEYVQDGVVEGKGRFTFGVCVLEEQL